MTENPNSRVARTAFCRHSARRAKGSFAVRPNVTCSEDPFAHGAPHATRTRADTWQRCGGQWQTAARGRRTIPCRTAKPRSPTPPTSPSPRGRGRGAAAPARARRSWRASRCRGTRARSRPPPPRPVSASSASPGSPPRGPSLAPSSDTVKATPPANPSVLFPLFPVRVERRVRVLGSAALWPWRHFTRDETSEPED
jgi:hypothetical protein